MIIKKLSDVEKIKIPGFQVEKQIVIGPDDGSNEIVLRHFILQPRGYTPRHTHDFPHIVKIESGKGIYIDKDNRKHKLTPGDFVYVNDNELHNFENTGEKPFEFFCIVPERGEL
ncbi:MAG: cupin domain-containing protein [Victivallales bacterium]|nr:cupin domain-containing protein [Victivallales bacterium]MCF7889407.1 cupin domain-containing protein [Victivallales bacterium]